MVPRNARTAHTRPVATYRRTRRPLARDIKIGFALLGFIALGLCCAGGTIINTINSGQPAAHSASPSPTRRAVSTPTAQPTSAEDVLAELNTTPASSAPATTPAATRKASAKPVYYGSCDAVRAAGKAPLRKGQPGYRTGLDRDRDGRACEPTEGPAPGGGDNGGGESVYYRNCAAVRAAGKAPIRRGDPGYGRHLDRDGDGVGCE